MNEAVSMATSAAILVLFAAMGFGVYRILRGPSLADRVVALDLIATLVVGFLALLSILTRQKLYLTAGIALALLAFLGTVALAIYIRRGGPP